MIKKYQKKKYIIVSTLSKYFHPNTFYRIGPILIDQQALKNKQSDSMLSIFFDFHKVIKTINKGFYLELQTSNFQIPSFNLGYIVQRFKSFGQNYFFHLAQLIENYCQSLKRYLQIQKKNYLDVESVLKQHKENTFIIFYTLFTQQYAKLDKIYISTSFSYLLGFSDEQIQLICTKYGKFINGYFKNGKYNERLIWFIEKCINYYKNNDKGEFEVMNKQRSSTLFRTKQNTIINCEYEFIFLRPQIYVLKIEKIIEQVEIKCIDYEHKKYKKMQEEIDQEQYSILQHLIKISQNKMKKNLNKVCGIRQFKYKKYIKQKKKS